MRTLRLFSRITIASSASDAVIAEGLQYTEDHDLRLRSVCLSGVLAESEMKRGRRDDAIADALGVLEQTGTMTVGRIPALTVIGTINMRRGEADAHAMLREALRLAEDTRGDSSGSLRWRSRWLRKHGCAAIVTVSANDRFRWSSTASMHPLLGRT